MRFSILSFVLITGVSVWSAWGQPASGPDSFLNQQRSVVEDVRSQLDKELPATQKFDFDVGGSYSFHLMLFDDGIDSSRTLRFNDWRVWTRASFDKGAHDIFARVRLGYVDFNAGDSYDGDDDDWEGPNLERGFYQFDLRKAVKAYSGESLNYSLRVKLGRDLTKLGTGLTMWNNLDQVKLVADVGDFSLTGLVGRTVGSDFDIDRTRYVDRTRRAIFAGQVEYTGMERHRPFIYGMWQRDHNEDIQYVRRQEFEFNSFYVGLGSTGELIDNLFYTTEWVYESGHNYGNQRFMRRNVVRAWAFDVGLEYLFEMKTHPRASVQYVYASGDQDRLNSPTDTMGGNRNDYTDRGFNAFGYRNTGLSFAPVLSNLHMWRCGASFYPFEGEDWVDRLELGTNWFLYWKNHRAAAVSDPTATVQSGYLGWEMDYYANWEITSDLRWTIRYGVFFPGRAFDDQTTRTFLLTGVTWSF